MLGAGLTREGGPGEGVGYSKQKIVNDLITNGLQRSEQTKPNKPIMKFKLGING